MTNTSDDSTIDPFRERVYPLRAIDEWGTDFLPKKRNIDYPDEPPFNTVRDTAGAVDETGFESLPPPRNPGKFVRLLRRVGSRAMR